MPSINFLRIQEVLNPLQRRPNLDQIRDRNRELTDRRLQDVEDDYRQECLGRCDLTPDIHEGNESEGDNERGGQEIDEDDRHVAQVYFFGQFEFSFSLAVEFVEEELLQGVYLYESDDLHDLFCHF